MTSLDPRPPGAVPDLDEVFRRHGDRLWSVALRLLGDPAEAEDAVQEAFVAALRAPGFRGDAAAATWLHRILVNGCVDRIRAAGRRRGHDRAAAPAAATADPAGGLVVRLAVGAALADLPVEQRAAVLLVDGLGYPVAEVAAILGVPAGTVKSRCARGRQRLAGALGHLREDDRR